jgi:presenilin-like A22 family membrane protease
MKHTIKITLILLAMFFLTQLIGLFVISQYSPQTVQITTPEGNLVNTTIHNLPYGMEPPQDISPSSTILSIIFALIIAVSLMLVLMKYKAEVLLRIWFFIVVTIAIAITLNSLILNFPNSALIAIIVALPIGFFKIFKNNILLHNLTELAIYPGIAAIFVPILNIWAMVLLLILISLYDMYAVWHSGFMQRMAKYQIQKVKVFSGFFIPYISKKQKAMLKKVASSKSKKALKNRKIKAAVAILGGGDVVFPLILAGVVLNALGFAQALLIAIGATIALAGLFYLSKKGKFYPAMPFITVGCFIGLALSYLI